MLDMTCQCCVKVGNSCQMNISTYVDKVPNGHIDQQTAWCSQYRTDTATGYSESFPYNMSLARYLFILQHHHTCQQWDHLGNQMVFCSVQYMNMFYHHEKDAYYIDLRSNILQSIFVDVWAQTPGIMVWGQNTYSFIFGVCERNIMHIQIIVHPTLLTFCNSDVLFQQYNTHQHNAHATQYDLTTSLASTTTSY